MSGIEIGATRRPAAGQMACGDQYVVVRAMGLTTVGVADGLGHGPLAAEAAEAFCRYVEDHAKDDLEQILWQASDALTATRGVAALVLRFDERRRTFSVSGVGNVEVRAVAREPIRPVSVPGIIGRRLRRTKLFEYPVASGDVIVAFTDGVSSRFAVETCDALDVQAMAEAVVRDHGKAHDDATCLVLRVGWSE